MSTQPIKANSNQRNQKRRNRRKQALMEKESVIPPASRSQQPQRAKKQKKKQQGVKRTEGPVSSIKGLHPSSLAPPFGTNLLLIKTDVLPSTLTYALATFESFLLVTANTALLDGIGQQSINALGSGISYLGNAIVQISSSGTLESTKLPRIFDVLTGLLTEKTVRIGPQEIRYTPNWGDQYEYPTSFTTPWGTVYVTTFPTAYGPSINIVNSTWTPEVNSYSNLLRICEGIRSWGSEVVDYGAHKAMYRRDPSAFARNYVYFGSGGPGSGLYSEAELEVSFNYPRFSRFVEYNTDDSVVSRVFVPQAGGISGPIGIPLLDSRISYPELKSPFPIIYKFINFYDVYNTLLGWLIGCYNSTPPNVAGNTFFTTPTPFSFSLSDFLFLLRQCVLTNFPSQIISQFVAPVAAVPSTSNSVFQPFIMDPICAPLQSVSNMYIPQFINENLSMLCAYSAHVNSTRNSNAYRTVPRRLRHDIIPVWGIYTGDVLPNPTFKDSQGQTQFIFSQTNKIPSCRLTDFVSDTNNNMKINVNSYLPAMLSEWNQRVQGYMKHLSTTISALSVDRNPHVCLLSYTRVIRKFGREEGVESLPPRLDTPMMNFIANRSQKFAGKVRIPPATATELYTESILGHAPVDQQTVSVLKNFIVPSIRFEYSNDDKLTNEAYAIYTTELCSTRNYNEMDEVQDELNRQMAVGSMMVQGLFGSNSNNVDLVEAVNQANQLGQGGSLIGTLLGGLASMIPVVGPAISSVVSEM